MEIGIWWVNFFNCSKRDLLLNLMSKSGCVCCGKESDFREYIRYQNETVFSRYEGTVIGKCAGCGTLKTFPKTNAVFDPQENHTRVYEKDIRKFEKLFQPIIDRVKHYKPAGRILDVGCATGILLSMFKKEGYDITGIEPNREEYRKAKKRLGSVVINTTINIYTRKHRKKFDVIVYNHVLEHIDDINNELTQAKKILKPGGLIVVGLPNTGNIIFLIRKKYWEFLMPTQHVWHFGKKQIRQLLQKNGFKIIDTSYSDDNRIDYPLAKKIYFRCLSFINRLLNTGEAQLLVALKIP